MSDNIYRFSHESVDAVTITEDDGTERTFIDAQRVAEVMLARIDADTTRLTLAVMFTSDMTDEQQFDMLGQTYTLMGGQSAYEFVGGFTAHLADVSSRLRAGLPAHEGDAPDAATIDAQVEAFADALGDVKPEDFTG